MGPKQAKNGEAKNGVLWGLVVGILALALAALGIAVLPEEANGILSLTLYVVAAAALLVALVLAAIALHRRPGYSWGRAIGLVLLVLLAIAAIVLGIRCLLVKEPCCPPPDGEALPFAAGSAFAVIQGPGGASTGGDDFEESAVDWAVPSDTPIHASEGGTVSFEGWKGQAGLEILVNTTGDRCDQYAHLSRATVDEGERVLRGQLIGYSGSSSNDSPIGTDSRLHWAGVECDTGRPLCVIETVESGIEYPVGAKPTSQNNGAELRNPQSGRCLDVEGSSTVSEAAVQLYDCGGTADQRWIYDGTTLKPSGYDDLCLDIEGGAFEAGTSVQLYTCNGTDAQKWLVESDGSIRTKAARSLCLDAAGGGTSNGTEIHVWPCNGTEAQRWL
jgi:hypothetical protein